MLDQMHVVTPPSGSTVRHLPTAWHKSGDRRKPCIHTPSRMKIAACVAILTLKEAFCTVEEVRFIEAMVHIKYESD